MRIEKIKQTGKVAKEKAKKDRYKTYLKLKKEFEKWAIGPLDFH